MGFEIIEGEYLIDTHVLIWAVNDSSHLPKAVKRILGDAYSQIYISPVSALEIATKNRIGKLDGVEYLLNEYREVLEMLGIEEVLINSKEMKYAGLLEWNNKDPFDRIIAAQSYHNGLPLITKDQKFGELKQVETIW